MSKDGLTQVEYALMLGRLRYEVIPLCWPSSTGYCGCGWNHKVNEVGKAPRVRKGVKAASSEAPKTEERGREGCTFTVHDKEARIIVSE